MAIENVYALPVALLIYMYVNEDPYLFPIVLLPNKALVLKQQVGILMNKLSIQPPQQSKSVSPADPFAHMQ